jgi:hypothetical protein
MYCCIINELEYIGRNLTTPPRNVSSCTQYVYSLQLHGSESVNIARNIVVEN